nr:hypothetical protein GCM10020241_28220 [Streptoalloteichus tenebrarius]
MRRRPRRYGIPAPVGEELVIIANRANAGSPEGLLGIPLPSVETTETSGRPGTDQAAPAAGRRGRFGARRAP